MEIEELATSFCLKNKCKNVNKKIMTLTDVNFAKSFLPLLSNFWCSSYDEMDCWFHIQLDCRLFNELLLKIFNKNPPENYFIESCQETVAWLFLLFPPP